MKAETRTLLALIVKDVLSLAVIRWDLVNADDEDLDLDIGELVRDVTNVVCGDDCGCLDPDDEYAAKINMIPNAAERYAHEFAAEQLEAIAELHERDVDDYDSIHPTVPISSILLRARAAELRKASQ